MRVLVISDIHANLAAFKAVLADAAGKYDFIWFLGDLIGYGPDPNECVSLLQEYDHIALSGNHDWAVLGKLDINGFNPEAKRAIEWTQDTVNQASHDYLSSLESITNLEPFTIAHASIRQPVWEYILDIYTAAVNFVFLPTPYGLIGHTHVPVIYEERGQNVIKTHNPKYDVTVQFGRNRLLVNPGSVGQPRDSDPRAAYALLNTEEKTWQFCRVEYPIELTQERMRNHDLPERLIARLSYGW
jgi:predicted phosphodiesterase